MSSDATSYLPIPEIVDQRGRLSFKQNNSDSFNFSKQPPKLYRKPHRDASTNRSFNSSTANSISFRESKTSSPAMVTPIYTDANQSESYFEQNFEILSKLGEGSFGEVFKVQSKEDGLLYAVKRSKQFYKGEHYRQERLEEVRRYEQLSEHEHCITLHKAWEQDYCLYMQLELCKGNLDWYLAGHKKLCDNNIWEILLDLLLALKALHDRDLIHLDIKLENILVDQDNVCKLGDFGLVVDINKQNLQDAIEGDSRYIAPELLNSQFSKAADIFSFGITILELACNLELPRNGELWQELRSGKLPQDCVQLISKDLKHIIEWTMNPDPLQRPTVNELLALPKIQQFLVTRQRWFRKAKKYPKQLARYVWQKLCCFKRYLSLVFSIAFAALALKDTKDSPAEKSLLQLDDSKIEDSPCKTASFHTSSRETDTVVIVNSTPLNHHGSFLRARKEQHLKGTPSSAFNDVDNFNLETSPRHSLTNEPNSSIIAKKLFFSDDSDSS